MIISIRSLRTNIARKHVHVVVIDNSFSLLPSFFQTHAHEYSTKYSATLYINRECSSTVDIFSINYTWFLHLKNIDFVPHFSWFGGDPIIY
jgi:hypothetical protein